MDNELRLYMRNGEGSDELRCFKDNMYDEKSGYDYALMTLEEFYIIVRYFRKTRRLMKQGNPYGYEDLMACDAIGKKNEFLRTLSEEEQDIVKAYNSVVWHHEVNPLIDRKTMQPAILPQEETDCFVNDYFELMNKYHLPVFEKPFYFIKHSQSTFTNKTWIKKR